MGEKTTESISRRYTDALFYRKTGYCGSHNNRTDDAKKIARNIFQEPERPRKDRRKIFLGNLLRIAESEHVMLFLEFNSIDHSKE